jgi:hypothetical protein
LDPAGPYTDGQQIMVTVQGWPGSTGQRPDLEIGHLRPRRRRELHHDPHVAPHPLPGGAQIDCTHPGNCQIALALTPENGFTRPGTAILGADVVVH